MPEKWGHCCDKLGHVVFMYFDYFVQEFGALDYWSPQVLCEDLNGHSCESLGDRNTERNVDCGGVRMKQRLCGAWRAVQDIWAKSLCVLVSLALKRGEGGAWGWLSKLRPLKGTSCNSQGQQGSVSSGSAHGGDTVLVQEVGVTSGACSRICQ